MSAKPSTALLAFFVLLGPACGGDVTVLDGGEGGASDGDSTGKGPNNVSAGAGAASNGVGGAPNGSGPNGSGPNGSGPNGSGGSSGQGASASGSGGGQQVCADFGTACSACVAEACPSDWCACTATFDCPQLFGCTDDCNGDPDCNQQCLEDHQGGISAAFLVSSCAGGPCAGSCPQGGEPLEPCAECLFQSCDDEMNACLVEPDCMPLWDCLKECAQLDLSCQDACYDTFGDGVDELETVFDCATASCLPSCGDD